jgi:hypothetical protein
MRGGRMGICRGVVKAPLVGVAVTGGLLVTVFFTE